MAVAPPTTPPAATPPDAATATATAAPHTPQPTHLVQQTSPVASALASYATDARGALSPYVLGADVLAGVSVAGALALAELRRRRLV